MKQVKLYNVIFPVWLLLFFPTFVPITLAGDFIIDSLVILACFFIYKLSDHDFNLKTFYKKHIIRVWSFGFLADFIGASLLFITTILKDPIITDDLITGINYDPYKYPLALLIIILAMLIASFLIYLFNYRITFRQIDDKKLRFKLAMTIAIITMPWTFLIPTKWIYHGL